MGTKGGKQPGAGRKPASNPAIKLATMKLTPTQHAKFLELGGSRWVKRLIVKRLIDEAIKIKNSCI